MVLPLTAPGLTSGQIIVHLADAYGLETFKETVSTITDKALESMTQRRTRPRGDPERTGGQLADLWRSRSPSTGYRDMSRGAGGGGGAKQWQACLRRSRTGACATS